MVETQGALVGTLSINEKRRDVLREREWEARGKDRKKIGWGGGECKEGATNKCGE